MLKMGHFLVSKGVVGTLQQTAVNVIVQIRSRCVVCVVSSVSTGWCARRNLTDPTPSRQLVTCCLRRSTRLLSSSIDKLPTTTHKS